MKFNDQQQAVIDAPVDVPAVVCSAGAGSGKTTVMVQRVKYLLSQGIKPADIIVVTLTKEAANEMWRRIINEMPQLKGTKLEKQVCTIHALNFRMVIRHTRKKYKVLDDYKERFTLKEQLETVITAVGFGAWHSKIEPDVLKMWIDRSKLEGFSTNQSRAFFEQHVDARTAEALFEARMRFDGWCKSNGYITFADMMLEADHLLRNEGIRKSESGKFVIVDEAQDTTRIAMSILARLAERGQIWMVGDINQTLFVFANAHPDHNIGSGFEARYPAGLRYPMMINYRSSRAIIEVANRLVANSYRLCPVCQKPSSEMDEYCDDCLQNHRETEAYHANDILGVN